jgi:6-pyruvoyl-tetrahydropterin synthase
MSDELKIRDFIYLDVERMKSIVSQIDEGWIERSTGEKGDRKHATAKAELSSGIFDFLKAKLGSEVGTLWETKESETKTLHDYMYILLEKKLKEEELIYIIDKSKTELKEFWEDGKINEKIPDTAFILVKGKVMIDDFRRFKSLATDFNRLWEAFSYFQVGQLPTDPDERKAVEIMIRKGLRDSNNWIDEKIMASILLLIEHFYQNELVIKSMPFPDNFYLKFIGNLNEDFLRDSIESITFKYGTAPVSEWRIFAQISSIFPENYDPSNFMEDPKYDIIVQNKGEIDRILALFQEEDVDITKVSPVDQTFLDSIGITEVDLRILKNLSMEFGLESVFNGFRTMDYALSSKFPYITFTPIAIYRGD